MSQLQVRTASPRIARFLRELEGPCPAQPPRSRADAERRAPVREARDRRIGVPQPRPSHRHARRTLAGVVAVFGAVAIAIMTIVHRHGA